MHKYLEPANMISVCIATYNGGKYIREQLESILSQLGEDDEVIISDDSSTDGTVSVVESIGDRRIQIFGGNTFHSPTYNFENALKKAKGDYIFLSDQDDVWKADKVKVMMKALENHDLVASDCTVVDSDLNVIKESYHGKLPSPKVSVNIIHNSYMGCNMAFRRNVLEKSLPFPKRIAMHDLWLGFVGATFFNAAFIPDRLILFRRHGENASSTGSKSSLSLGFRIRYRLDLLLNLMKRRLNLI